MLTRRALSPSEPPLWRWVASRVLFGGVLEQHGDGRITGYTEKPSIHYVVSAGVNLIGARARALLRRGERCDVPTLVQRLIGEGEIVAGYESDAYWRDIGRPADYEAADAEFPELRTQFGL